MLLLLLPTRSYTTYIKMWSKIDSSVESILLQICINVIQDLVGNKTIALLIVYFTLLRKILNLKMAHLEPKHIVERNNVRIHLNKIINWVVFDDVLLSFYNSIQYNGDVSPGSYPSLLLSRHLLRGLRKRTKNLQLSAYWIQAGSIKSLRMILVSRQETFLCTVTDIIASRY
jgi:hypothetical protein